jgi:hypothetical protein
VSAAALAAALTVMIAVTSSTPAVHEPASAGSSSSRAEPDDAAPVRDEAVVDPDASPVVPEAVAPPETEPATRLDAEAAPQPHPERRATTAPAPTSDPHSSPDPKPTPTPTPAPRPDPTPGPDPEPMVSATPMLDGAGDLDAPIPAPITGRGSAGASVALIDDAGSTLVTAIVGDNGRFSAAIPGDMLRAGMTVRAVQTEHGEAPSAPSEAVGPFTVPVPTVTASDRSLIATLRDADSDGDAADLYLLLDGHPGKTVAVSFDGVWTGNLHLLTGTPLVRVVYDTTPGAHVVGFRYVDPATGREGRVATVTIVALAD